MLIFVIFNFFSAACTNLECVQIQSQTVSVHREEVNWFQARDSCRTKYKSDLAEFPLISVNTVINSLKKNLNVSGHFWIGLRQSLWKIDIPDSISIGVYKWNHTASNDLYGCTIYSKGLWLTSDCSVKHPYICVSEGETIYNYRPTVMAKLEWTLSYFTIYY